MAAAYFWCVLLLLFLLFPTNNHWYQPRRIKTSNSARTNTYCSCCGVVHSNRRTVQRKGRSKSSSGCHTLLVGTGIRAMVESAWCNVQHSTNRTTSQSKYNHTPTTTRVLRIVVLALALVLLWIIAKIVSLLFLPLYIQEFLLLFVLCSCTIACSCCSDTSSSSLSSTRRSHFRIRIRLVTGSVVAVRQRVNHQSRTRSVTLLIGRASYGSSTYRVYVNGWTFL